ncbi:MAG: hypothetical protein HUU28_05690 [Planctomycetaceae bacterium]|jgi:hypothetical protein|nr:hypothetical protein [Planctomycetaceae bacterium]
MNARIRPSFALVVLLALLSAFVGLAALQARPKIPPPTFERETEADATGQKQWKKFDVDCPECKGSKMGTCLHCDKSEVTICNECNLTKRAPCRVCTGKGKLADPLVELNCAYCWGSSWTLCGMCNSFGFMNIDSNKVKCAACKEKGLLKCLACNGTRRVETMKFGKKPVGEAGVKELKAGLEKLKAVMAELEKWEPDPNPSKSAKSLEKLLSPLAKDLKVIEPALAGLEEVIKGIKINGASLSGYEDRLIHQYLLFKDRTVFLLQHQMRAAEQSLARAEANETK